MSLLYSGSAVLARPSAKKNVKSLRMTGGRQRMQVVAFRLSELPDVIAKGFLQFLTPPQDTVKDWKNTSHNFTGKVSHGSRKPFQDGFTAEKSASAVPVKEEERATEEGVVTDENMEDYLGGAARRLVGHNFTGDGTEPSQGCGSEGWKGEIHTRSRPEGFHSKSF